jgi:hypothetical protein
MNDIGWTLLLNLYFWIGAATALLLFGVWACIEIFLGAAHKAQETIRVARGRTDTPNRSPGSEEDEEWYGNGA